MDRMSSIEMALHNERTEMHFYRAESKRSRNPLAKAMFDGLARDEQEHMKRIQTLHKKLLAEGAWPADVPIEVRGTHIREVLDDLVRAQNATEDQDGNDMAALEKAIAFEARGARFYADLSALCENPAEKKFFEFLAGIEREHHLSLTDSLAYLKDPKGWMAEHEKAGLDGA